MQGVELPCDWTVNRRPHHASSSKTNEPAEEGGSERVIMDIPVNPLGPRIITTTPSVPPPLSSMMPNHGTIRRLVLDHLSTETEQQEPSEMTLVVDSLLSRLPYKKMLSDMFGGNLRGSLQNSQIPYVTRAYEESYMREVQHAGERECPRGELCECMFIDPQQAFVGVEFLLPSEERPTSPHLCVLCCRAITQQLYYDIMFDKVEFPGVIQRFGNMHSEPGEYALDAMLIAAPSAPVHIMPLPIVSHQRNRYVVYVQGGIKRLRQSRVYFQHTPSCNVGSG